MKEITFTAIGIMVISLAIMFALRGCLEEPTYKPTSEQKSTALHAARR